ncbi:DUF1772 domain-containing protein [Notoacmeibacter marinus]|uniref:DUF1772 domain-containing protein n=1 Tax=Notoacmeibacter marinus TaxID=1876515 RepID=UPI000DF23FB2|nr:DUF1772 domain-containing protein [Notoacmeibacter marinus]
MKLLRLLALNLTALIFVPSAAHLFELPAKISLDRDAYFLVQGIYAGWATFGVAILAAVAANGSLAFAERSRDPVAARWATLSATLIAVSLTVFFIWVFPANQATANWTRQPTAWETLRRQWEYGHAVNAGIVWLAFLATSVAVMRRDQPQRSPTERSV